MATAIIGNMGRLIIVILVTNVYIYDNDKPGVENKAIQQGIGLHGVVAPFSHAASKIGVRRLILL